MVEAKTRELTIIPPLALVCQVFVIFPFVIYLGNLAETGVTILTFIGFYALLAATALALLLGIRRLLPEALRAGCDGLLSILTILFWIQGALLVRDYGLLDGASIDWEAFGYAGLIDAGVWTIGLIVGITLIRLGKDGLLFRAAGFLVAIQFASTVVETGLKFEDLQFKQIETHSADPTQFYEFSKTQNIIHILVDGFQSDVFADLTGARQTVSDYAEMFRGFVYFRETLGVFPYTQFALPALLTGKIYLNKETKNAFLNRTMAGPSILGAAEKNGFEIDVAVAGAYLYGQYAKSPHDSIFQINSLGRANPTISSMLKFADLATFRLVPHGIKRFVYNDQKWLFQPMAVEDESFRYEYFQNTYFLEQLTHKLSVTREEPVYKYMHVSNTHNPMVANSDCGYAGQTFDLSRTTLTIQSMCTLNTLSAFFDKLRAAGIYDSSLIVLHADHGGWVPNRRQGQPIRLTENTVLPPQVASLASPLLAIKPPNSDGPMVVSDAYVSLLDLPDTIGDIMRFDVKFGHKSAFDEVVVSPNRIRRFYFYTWQRNELEADYTEAIHEFMIQGSHYENEWILRSIHRRP
jgi:hypothetical protein